jgi:hypothetical protein
MYAIGFTNKLDGKEYYYLHGKAEGDVLTVEGTDDPNFAKHFPRKNMCEMLFPLLEFNDKIEDLHIIEAEDDDAMLELKFFEVINNGKFLDCIAFMSTITKEVGFPRIQQFFQTLEGARVRGALDRLERKMKEKN